MNIIYKNKSKNAGIYRILNLQNGRMYYGSTYEFRKRFKTHINSLLASRHENTFLQNDFHKCGKQNFIIEVIEVVEGTKEERLLIEQKYLDQYYDYQKQCYNLRRYASDSREGRKNIKTADPLTDKRLQIPSQDLLKKRGDAIRQAFIDNPQMRLEAAERARKGKWKDYSANITLINPKTNEEVFITTSLRQFAIDNNLSYKSLHLLTRKKTKSCGGWKLKE